MTARSGVAIANSHGWALPGRRSRRPVHKQVHLHRLSLCVSLLGLAKRKPSS